MQDIKNEEHISQEEQIAELLNKKEIDVHNIKISKRKDGNAEKHVVFSRFSSKMLIFYRLMRPQADPA